LTQKERVSREGAKKEKKMSAKPLRDDPVAFLRGPSFCFAPSRETIFLERTEVLARGRF
jgi:hypothetical protein